MRKSLLIFAIALLLLSGTAIAQEQEAVKEKKSVAGALFRSLAIPGWGEYYGENYTAAKWTFGAEVAIWLSYFYFDGQNRSLESDYKNLAITHAGVSSGDRPKQYWIDVGSSNDIYNHNIKAAQDRDAEAIYRDIETYYWRWETPGYRADYNHIRVKSGQFAEYAEMTFGAHLLTRLVSSVLAVRSVNRYNRGLKEKKEIEYGIIFRPKMDSGEKYFMSTQLQIRF